MAYTSFDKIWPGQEWNSEEALTDIRRQTLANIFKALKGRRIKDSALKAAHVVLKELFPKETVQTDPRYITWKDIQEAQKRLTIPKQLVESQKSEGLTEILVKSP